MLAPACDSNVLVTYVAMFHAGLVEQTESFDGSVLCSAVQISVKFGPLDVLGCEDGQIIAEC